MVPTKLIEFIEGCIAGAGIGFCLGVLTMSVELPYQMGAWGIPIGGVLFLILSKKQLRMLVLVLAFFAIGVGLSS